MTHDEFMFYLNKIGSAFGKSDKQIESLVDVYYASMPEITSEQMRKTTDFILKNNERFPSIKDITIVLRMYYIPKRSVYTTCHACWGDGIIRSKNKKGYRTIWKCNECNNCTYNYPIWNNPADYTKEYLIDWDINDDYQIKDLIVLGEGSIIWKKVPKEMQDKALKLNWIPPVHKTPEIDLEERLAIREADGIYDILGNVNN